MTFNPRKPGRQSEVGRWRRAGRSAALWVKTRKRPGAIDQQQKQQHGRRHTHSISEDVENSTVDRTTGSPLHLKQNRQNNPSNGGSENCVDTMEYRSKSLKDADAASPTRSRPGSISTCRIHRCVWVWPTWRTGEELKQLSCASSFGPKLISILKWKKPQMEMFCFYYFYSVFYCNLKSQLAWKKVPEISRMSLDQKKKKKKLGANVWTVREETRLLNVPGL